MECFAVNYQCFPEEEFPDMSTIIELLSVEREHSNWSSASSSPNSSRSSRGNSSLNSWPDVTSLEAEFRDLLFKEITSPLNTLDDIRFTERHDFEMNGIDRELDEFGRYQVRLRPYPQMSQPMLTECHKHSKRDEPKSNTVCVFCKNNGEKLSVYGSHLLKDSSGRVACPILRRYTCPICGVSGDSAHTVRYCPQKNILSGC